MNRSQHSFVRVITNTILIVVTLVLLCVSAQAAVSVVEYQKQLKGAITALDTLSQIDENESGSAYEQRLTQTVAAIKTTVPEKESVEAEGSVYEVENSWLHDGLREFEVASNTQRDRIRAQLIERLRSLDERVDELVKASVVNSASKDEANRKLAEILSRAEYTNKSNRGLATVFKYIERFAHWLAKFLPERSIRSGNGKSITWIVEIVIFGLAAVVIVLVLRKMIQRFMRRPRSPGAKKTRKEAKIVLGEHLTPEASAPTLLAEAEALARSGQIRAAIRKAYIALLVELGDRKVISLAQHKTNRDYLRAVRSHPTLYKNMTGLTDSFERHWYGFEQTNTSDWQEFVTGYSATLNTTD
ncbi:MAG TPA: DUF4129 domain-containing protein [Pyrinomonadaceae bacterium]